MWKYIRFVEWQCGKREARIKLFYPSLKTMMAMMIRSKDFTFLTSIHETLGRLNPAYVSGRHIINLIQIIHERENINPRLLLQARPYPFFNKALSKVASHASLQWIRGFVSKLWMVSKLFRGNDAFLE